MIENKVPGMNLSLRTARRALCGAFLGFLLVLLGACGNNGSGTPGSGVSTAKASELKSRTVNLGVNPQNTVLDPATHTLYAISDPENNAVGTVSVLNTSKCNALHASGCTTTAPSVQVGKGPVAIALDQGTDTIYVVNSSSNTVSVISGATCDALNTSGCSRTPPAVKAGNNPVDVTVDQATGTVYVADWGNGAGTTVSVIDGRTCDATITSGCEQIRATIKIGAAPAGVVADQSNDTVYAATVAPNGTEAVSVIDGSTCNATTRSGCDRKPPSVTVGRGSANYNVAFAIDQAAGTLYVANWTDDTLSMIDKVTCNATVTSGCAQTPRVARVGSGPDGVALNAVTHTLYVSNVSDDTVSVLDAAICNATVTTGCDRRPARLRTGASPRWVTVDQATDTVYVPNGDDDTMSVLNGAMCSATVTSGCG
jgi:DNA-binding beta-propeller fold protein YncE